MDRAALVDADGLVVNVIVPGPTFTPPAGLELVEISGDGPVGPGYRRTETGWEAPTDPVEEVDPDDELADAIGAATTVEELKAALLGTGPDARARAAGRRADR